jgi:hypothetical protein
LEAKRARFKRLARRNRDRQGVATLLREWERGTATAWKIEHLWEPTAFPFEPGA